MSEHTTAAMNEQFLVNELLAYASYYINRCPIDKLHPAIVKFFVPAEIELAKDALWPFITESDPSKKKTLRKDSTSRSASEANVADILQALKNTDLEKVNFVARDLERLPKWGPEEISLLALADRLAHVEAELLVVKEDVANISQTKLPTSNTEQASQRPAEGPSRASQRQPVKPTYSNAVKVQPSSLVSSVPPRSQTSGQRNNFPVSQVSHKPSVADRNRKPARPKGVVGKSKNDKIKGESRKTDIFLYRVSKITDDQEIKSLFTNAGIPIYSMEKVSHKDAQMKSFKITIPLTDYENVCNEQFLPENIMCRRFYKPRQKKPSESHFSSASEPDDVDAFFE